MAYASGRLQINAETCCDPPLHPCPPRKPIPPRLIPPIMPFPPGLLARAQVSLTDSLPQAMYFGIGKISCGDGFVE